MTNKSPTIPPRPMISTMDFYQALEAVERGESITRTTWDQNTYAQMRNDVLMIYTEDWHTWIIHRNDMTAIDWVIHR